MILWIVGRRWQAGRVLTVAVFAVSFAFLFSLHAQGQSAPSVSSAGRATVYVYRPSNRDKDVELPIYMNGHLVTSLEPSTYAKGVAPQGKLVVAAIDSKYQFFKYFERNGRWLSLPGCGTLDQYRLDSLGEVEVKQQEDLARCKDSLKKIQVMIGFAQSGGSGAAEMIRACNFTGGYNQLDLTNCDAEMDGALNFVSQTVGGSYTPPARITIDVEAGKTYYLRWTKIHAKPDKIEVVDSVTGADEISKLQPAAAR